MGIQLGIPRYKLLEFKKEDDPLSAVVDYWLSGNVAESCSPMSWESIVTALKTKYVGEPGLAEEISRRCYKPKVQASPPSMAPPPSLHSNPMDTEIRLDLEFILRKNLKDIIAKYAAYVDTLRIAVRDKDVSVEDLRSFLLSLSATSEDSKVQSLSLLSEKEDELKHCESVTAIFNFLTVHCTSFLNYDVFQYIQKYYKIGEDIEHLQYPEYLLAYINKHRISEFTKINPLLRSKKNSKELTLKCNITMTCKLAKVCDLKLIIAEIMDLSPSALEIVDIEDGCVIVTFLIPASVADALFTPDTLPTRKQMTKLKAADVFWLKCNGCTFQFGNTTNSSASEGGSDTESVQRDQMDSESTGEEEPTVSTSTVINVHQDHSLASMYDIEKMARQILKTGKLTIIGEPGDMSKVQPAMFSLQASEKDIAQLIPQLIQIPLFYHRELYQMNPMGDFDKDVTVFNQDEALARGNLRVAVPVDTAIYALLQSNCAKGMRQADEVINTIMRATYIPYHPASMPPIVKFNLASRHLSTTSQSSKHGTATQLTPQTLREEFDMKKKTSSSFIPAEGSTTSSGYSSTQSLPSVHTSYSGSSEVLDMSRWNTSILKSDTIVAQCGGVPYPIVWWDPSFKIDFRLTSSIGLLSGTVIGIDPHIPLVTLKVFNSSSHKVGFAIRSHRQSSIFSSHVVYPMKGLHVLEPHKTWEDNVEFVTTNPSAVEMFVIDLFLCTLDENPVWNIMRKYAIMKAQNSRYNLSKRRQSYSKLPGNKEAKEGNLEVVLSHGLQCVVKGKLPEAEIIFSQALYLPDFQRVPLKAFVYTCLAIVANKRVKERTAAALVPVMVAAESASRLVSICEDGSSSPMMPYTIQLVKQLKKDINLQKMMKELRTTGHQRVKHRVDIDAKEFKNITPESGAELNHKLTIVTIPPGAVIQPTTISLSLDGSHQLISMIKASGWSKIVQIATAIYIDCKPPLNHFKKPIRIKTKLPEGMKLGKSALVRLMHSNYLHHWEDITDDVLSKISISGEDVLIETNLPGWLVLSVIQFDASKLTQMVLNSISIDPIMLKLSVFGFIDAERKSIHMVIFAVPCKANGEPIHKKAAKPENFLSISIPRVVQAFSYEKLQFEIQGAFEPDIDLGENSLTFRMDVQQKHNQTHTLWVKSTSTSEFPPSGKLRVSSRQDKSDKWKNIANISLSMRTNLKNLSYKQTHLLVGENKNLFILY